ncbi:hypothetical protein DN730_13305 [Marinomonas piezotolerans]|uniref:Uncharacterized protein n=1 Tax=Marinomonas piezotolerans TaxID=2213058 RepID=A0A370U7K2_9GAMM|nr:hypothetical protein [Marinomonas piezotolerans]RDL43718.1 hypothetical protein DN730_13305 [Marinomonas piezotolerans]
MFVTLQPLEEATISGRGETVVYVSGSEPLLLMASSKRAEIPSGSQITFPAFDQFTVQNKGESPVSAELLVVEGEFRSLAEGSTVRIQSITDPVEVNEVQRIVEAVTANISNTGDISNPIVTALAQMLTANVSNTGDISDPIVTALAQTLTADVSNTGDISSPIVTALAQTLTANVSNAGDISSPIVTALAQTLTANVSNTGDISSPIVTALAQTLTANVSNTGDISNPIVTALAQTLTANVSNTGDISNPIVAALAQTLEILEKPATSLASSSKTFIAGESYTIPANANRRDVRVTAAKTNTDLVTVGGVELAAGEQIEFKKYVGTVQCSAVSADVILITEVIK